jgi:crossover junction endodeoxyribonuclease RuvC
MSIVCGIDVGASGAIALIDSDTNELVFVEDMPIHRVQIGATLRSRIDRVSLLGVLTRARGASVFVERPDYRPMRQTDKATGRTVERQMGTAGAGAFGESYGCVLMGCTAAAMSLTEMRSGQWKRAMSFGASKDDIRRRMQELFPSQATLFARKKDDGRADATGLALYGVRWLRGEVRNAAALIAAD